MHTPAKLLILLFLVYPLLFIDLSVADTPPLSRTLIVAPHPDDEVICCSAIINRLAASSKPGTLSENLRIVILTKQTSPNDTQEISSIRLTESRKALEILTNASNTTAVLQSYDLPDGNLSAALQENNQPPQLPAKAVSHLASLIEEFKPAAIYFPHYADNHRDHRAAYFLVRNALKYSKTLQSKPRLFSYLVHGTKSTINEQTDKFAFALSPQEQALEKQALEAFASQRDILQKLGLFDNPSPEAEFYELAFDKTDFITQLRKLWAKTNSVLSTSGYNVNMGFVADLNNEAPGGNYLNMSSRTYSSDPEVIASLLEPILQESMSYGLIPVLKHFPGLGRSAVDTHRRLSYIKVSKKELMNTDLAPYRELLRNKSLKFWIMPGHAVYSDIDSKPASISRIFLTDILRNELGFNGIIISDELSTMQSLREYAKVSNIANDTNSSTNISPFFVYEAFRAGTDLAIVYFTNNVVRDRLTSIVSFLEHKLEIGEWSQKELDASLKRILEEKYSLYPKLFSSRPEELLKHLSTRDKLLQKIITDDTLPPVEAAKLGISGIHFRNPFDKKAVLANAKIPPFFIAQHEGGEVTQREVRESSNPVPVLASARRIGASYEALNRSFVSEDQLIPTDLKPDLNGEYSEHSPSLTASTEAFRARLKQFSREYSQQIVRRARHAIASFSWMSLWGHRLFPVRSSPSMFGPIAIGPDADLYLRSIESLPYSWVETFSSNQQLLDTYNLIALAYSTYRPHPKPMPVGTESMTSDTFKRSKELEAALCRVARELKMPSPNPRLLVVSAHPDDEDGLAMAYFKEKYNFDTYAVFATKGEGGKNFIDNHFGRELGLLRINETKAAMDILGVKKFWFLTAPDFGYSTKLDEVWQHWDRKQLISELSYLIRLVRPSLILSKHSLKDDHAQHRAILEILKESLIAVQKDAEATDPFYYYLGLNDARWPLPAITTWIHLDYSGNSPNSKPQIEIDPCSDLGTGELKLNELAFRALGMHRSQAVSEPQAAVFFGKSNNRGDKTTQTSCPISFVDLISQGRSDSSGDFAFSPNFTQIDTCDEPLEFVSKTSIPGVITTAKSKCGIITGNSTTTELSLELLGINCSVVDEAKLKEGLDALDVVLVDRLAFRNLIWLSKEEQRLKEFVTQGGKLVILTQYKNGDTNLPFLGLNQPQRFVMKEALQAADWKHAQTASSTIPTDPSLAISPLLFQPNPINPNLLKTSLGPVGEAISIIANMPPHSSSNDSVTKINNQWQPIIEVQLDQTNGALLTEQIVGAGSIIYISLDIEEGLQSLDRTTYKLLANLVR